MAAVLSTEKKVPSEVAERPVSRSARKRLGIEMALSVADHPTDERSLLPAGTEDHQARNLDPHSA
jgi:hypothetical protein